MNQIEIATKIAEKAFAGKTDMGGEPYIKHLERIKNIVYERCPNGFDLQCIALLHDLLEDCPEWNEKSLSCFFYDRIINAVVALTHKEEQSYDEYIQQVSENSDAVYIKLIDLKDNMDVTRLKVLTDNDLKRIKKYHTAYNFLKQL